MSIEQPTVSQCKPMIPPPDSDGSTRKDVTLIKSTDPVARGPRAGDGDTKHDSAAGACWDQMPLNSSASGSSIPVAVADVTNGTVKLNVLSESSTATSAAAAADGNESSKHRFLELIAHVTNWLTTTNKLEQFRTGSGTDGGGAGGGGVDTIRITFPTTGSGDRVVCSRRSVDETENAMRKGKAVDVDPDLQPRVPGPCKLKWNRPLSATNASHCGEPAVTVRAGNIDCPPVSISDKQDVNLRPRSELQLQPLGPHVARDIVSKLLDTIRASHSRKVTVSDETFLMTSSSSIEAEICGQQHRQTGLSAPISIKSEPHNDDGEQHMQQSSTDIETVGSVVVQSMPGIQRQMQSGGDENPLCRALDSGVGSAWYSRDFGRANCAAVASCDFGDTDYRRL